jgi:hypothetical protein
LNEAARLDWGKPEKKWKNLEYESGPRRMITVEDKVAAFNKTLMKSGDKKNLNLLLFSKKK